MTDKVSKSRWLVAQEKEKKGIESADDIREWIRIRRHTWSKLIDYLKGDVPVDDAARILDVGCGPTSIFLGLRNGQKYAIDPNLENILAMHPFIRDVEEYKDVTFIAEPLEAMPADIKFNLIFLINMLDHVDDVKAVIDKAGALLAPSGFIVVIVDCYADSAVKNIMKFFDIDLPHPHHFVADDIMKLFSMYKLTRLDHAIFKLHDDYTFKGETRGIKIYRIDRFIKRMWQIIKTEGKQKDIAFIAKYFICYFLALSVALARRCEQPVYPFKKERLFIFQKS